VLITVHGSMGNKDDEKVQVERIQISSILRGSNNICGSDRVLAKSHLLVNGRDLLLTLS